jgi:hypothetical protein
MAAAEETHYEAANTSGHYSPAEPAQWNANDAPARAEGADMAALMRELSSLSGGFDDEAAPSPVISRPVHNVSNESRNGKKKKGIFGR